MRSLQVGMTVALLTLTGCSAPAPVEPPVIETPTVEQPPTEPTVQAQVSWCDQFDPTSREWFELESASVADLTSSAGVVLSVSSTSLPPNPSGRFNAVAEVCPGLLLGLSASGDAHLIATNTKRYSPLPTLQPRNPGDDGAGPGVNAGVPTFGFRDAIVIEQTVVVSDAVIDTAAECVRVEARSIDLATWVDASVAELDTVYSPATCVSYADSHRASAPIKTHLGGALAYHPGKDELYLSIGDLHLGISSISQAVSIGIDNAETDYELLLDPAEAISAVVAISQPLEGGTARIMAKGLRNSLGMTVDSDGVLWLSDHGPRGGDELNIITDGADYGWPLTSEGSPYDRSAWPENSEDLPAPWLDINQAEIPGSTAPHTTWSPAIAPTAVVDYRSGDQGIEAWDGHLVLGSLRGESLIVVDRETGEVDRLTLGLRLRDLTSDVASRLISVTDSNELVIVEPAMR